MKFSELIKNYKDNLVGGKGDKTSPYDVDRKQLMIGFLVEREHSSNNLIALEIAIDHLTENQNYYTELIETGIADEENAIALYNKLYKQEEIVPVSTGINEIRRILENELSYVKAMKEQEELDKQNQEKPEDVYVKAIHANIAGEYTINEITGGYDIILGENEVLMIGDLVDLLKTNLFHVNTGNMRTFDNSIYITLFKK